MWFVDNILCWLGETAKAIRCKATEIDKGTIKDTDIGIYNIHISYFPCPLFLGHEHGNVALIVKGCLVALIVKNKVSLE